MLRNGKIRRRGRTGLRAGPYGAARILALVVAALAPVVGAATATAADPQTEAANAAVAYISTLQHPDGGFPGFEGASSPGQTIDAVFALAAAEGHPLDVTNDGNSAADYLETVAAEYAADPGAAAKLALGVLAMGLDPSDFGGVDLLAIMDEGVDPETGAFGLDMFDEAFYVLAVVAAGEPAPELVVDHMRTSRAQDGGWEFGPGFGSDSNTTALVLQAMLAAGIPRGDHPVAVAVGYLRSIQHESGAWGFLPDTDPDAQSTAFAIQALAAAGEDVGPGGPWAREASPLEALLAFQSPETGAFQFAGEDSAFATFQAVPGVLLAPFPSLQSTIILEEAEETPTEAPEEPEPTATLTPGAIALPAAGSGPSAAGRPMWLPVLLALGSAGAAGAVLLGRSAR